MHKKSPASCRAFFVWYAFPLISDQTVSNHCIGDLDKAADVGA